MKWDFNRLHDNSANSKLSPKQTQFIINLTHNKLIRNSSANPMPAKAVPIDNKRSPSKLDILLLSLLLLLIIIGRRPL